MLDWNFIASQIATIAFDIVLFRCHHRNDCHHYPRQPQSGENHGVDTDTDVPSHRGLVFYFFFGRSQRRVRMIGKKSYSRLLKKPMAEYLAQDSCTLPINYSRLISLFRNTNRLSPSMETGWKSIPWGSPCCNPCCANWGKQRSISTWNSISLRTMPSGAWCVMS